MMPLKEIKIDFEKLLEDTKDFKINPDYLLIKPITRSKTTESGLYTGDLLESAEFNRIVGGGELNTLRAVVFKVGENLENYFKPGDLIIYEIHSPRHFTTTDIVELPNSQIPREFWAVVNKHGVALTIKNILK